VYDEIYSVLGDSDRDVTPDDIYRFKYLEMVLKETLRLFPPGAIFSRIINENVKLSEYAQESVDKNLTIIVVHF
jgi:cytochrome P450 family 4